MLCLVDDAQWLDRPSADAPATRPPSCSRPARRPDSRRACVFGFTAALDRHGGSTRPFEHALGYHLCKVFLKLGLSSRAELARLTLDEVEASA